MADVLLRRGRVRLEKNQIFLSKKSPDKRLVLSRLTKHGTKYLFASALLIAKKFVPCRKLSGTVCFPSQVANKNYPSCCFSRVVSRRLFFISPPTHDTRPPRGFFLLVFKSIYLINLHTEERWLDSFAERINNPPRSMWWRTQRQRRRPRKRKEGHHHCLLGSPLLLRRARMTFPELYPRPCRLQRRTALVVVVGWRGGIDAGVQVKSQGTTSVESSSRFRL